MNYTLLSAWRNVKTQPERIIPKCTALANQLAGSNPATLYRTLPVTARLRVTNDQGSVCETLSPLVGFYRPDKKLPGKSRLK